MTVNSEMLRLEPERTDLFIFIKSRKPPVCPSCYWVWILLQKFTIIIHHRSLLKMMVTVNFFKRI